MRRNRSTWTRGAVALAACVAVGAPAAARAQSTAVEARRLVPWLAVPASWLLNVENGVVGATPGDLSAGATLILLVEPESGSSEPLRSAYEQALRDLGPWKPVGEPLEEPMDSGWVFRHGVGVATLNGTKFTGHTAVARRADRMVRLWALANSDATYNRYKDAIVNAIASVQDIPGARAAAADVAMEAAARPAAGLPSGFGVGLSGVYVGIERGAGAMAAVAPGGGPAPGSQIGDYMEVDVLYPDGTYRRRLPIRGLASDQAWERRQQPVLWGTWSRDGSRVTVRRGSYTTTYTIDGAALISDRGRPWVKLEAPSGARLDGVYARADFRDADAPRLVLRADGTYEDRGGFLRMVGGAWHLVYPDGDTLVERWTSEQAARAMGASIGTYSLDAFTLTLRAQDGRIWQINAYVPAGERLPRPARLVINGRALVRE